MPNTESSAPLEESEPFDPKKQYRCDACGGVFDFGWSDEEAKAEQEANGWSGIDCGIVCDDCFKAMGFA